MLKHLSLAILFLLSQLPLWAHEISGQVRSGEQPLAGIVVTDGSNFTQTNSDGTFHLDAADQADFVYIFTPSGYSAPYESGTPAFYQSLKQANSSFIFDLEKLPFTNERYALLAMADPQTKTQEQFDRFERESVTDLQATIDRYTAENTNSIGIALGDIAWDELELFNNYKQAMAGLHIPFYPVIGNHDHDLSANDEYSGTEVYRQQFGPTDYGFQLGNQYYLVLDNINLKGPKKYDTDLTDAQINWIANYLKFVPKGSDVIFAMHAPFYMKNKDQLIEHGQQLLDLCKDYHISFLSGHTHLNSTREVVPGIWEHNIGAICGSWWTADECRDGTPIGYQVFEGQEDSFSWYYKSVGKDPSYQLKLYDRGQVVQQPNAVVAKIWNWDPNWKVHWFEDEKPMGEMTQVQAYDPDYLRYLHQQNPSQDVLTSDNKKELESYFFFAAQPSPGCKVIRVVATDDFGRQFSQQIELQAIDVEAHRGGSGLMPENTLESMLNAVKMGANTLELDLHITQDGKVIVVHDAHFNPAFTAKPNGEALSDKEAEKYYFYRMNYDDIRQYDTGTRYYDHYPDQAKLPTHIPLLSELIDTVETYVSAHGMSPMHYNIEIKSDKKLEKKKLIPAFESFSDKAMEVIQSKNIGDRYVIQSFDTRCLNYMHERYPQVRLVYLVESILSLEDNLQKLDFTPDVYSPYHLLVNSRTVNVCHEAGIKVIPWTVDEEKDMQQLLDLGVDGIITNYPNRLLKLTRQY